MRVFGLRIFCLLFAATLLTPVAVAEQQAAPTQGTFDFEPGPDAVPWGGGSAPIVQPDDEIFRGGARSARIRRDADSKGSFTPVTFSVPADREGSTVELRGWMKSDNVDGWFGLWLRQDSGSGIVGFDNMQKRELSGTTDWTEYNIRLPLSSQADKLVCGALMAGTGTLWVDDLSLWIDGKPYAQAPAVVRQPTVLDTDTEFANGSGIEITALSDEQADNLALLGRVWGFLKYHHPVVTAGEKHWDFELFRIAPRMLAASNPEAARGALVEWIDGLGPIPACDPCAEEAVDPAQPKRVDWIGDASLLGNELSNRLVAAYEARPADGVHFWVKAKPIVRNPDFDQEPAYMNLKQLDAGYRLLALFRFWNIIEYWSPNRDLIDEDWPALLREFVPDLVQAGDDEAYGTAMLKLAARVKDTHTQLNSSAASPPPAGGARVPVHVRWIEGQAVITAWTHESAGPLSGLAIGDIITAIDGESVDALMQRWAPYYAASNEPRRNKHLAEALVGGLPGKCRLSVLRDGQKMEIEAGRMLLEELDLQKHRFHTLSGEAYRILEPGVAYLALDRIKRDSVQEWITDAVARNAAGLVIDCRAYPSDFPIFSLGGHLVAEPTSFVTFTRADYSNPGAFLWEEYTRIAPIAPHFDRPVVILVDETSISSAEYHALAFRAAPQAVVMGSTTAGADGNISPFTMPGGLRTQISGIGVYDDEHNNTQRVGIVPDVVVEPTVAGIRAGKDEVLETAVARIIGREVTEKEASAW